MRDVIYLGYQKFQGQQEQQNTYAFHCQGYVAFQSKSNPK